MVTHQVPKKLAMRIVRNLRRAESDIFELIDHLLCVMSDDAPLTIEEVDAKLACAIECGVMARARLHDELREMAAKGGGCTRPIPNTRSQ